MLTTRPLIDWDGRYVPPDTVVDTTDWPQEYVTVLVTDGVLVAPETPTDVGTSEPVQPVDEIVDLAGEADRPQQVST